MMDSITAAEFHARPRLAKNEAMRHCGMDADTFNETVRLRCKPVVFRDRQWWDVAVLNELLAQRGMTPVPREQWVHTVEAIETKIHTRQMRTSTIDHAEF